MTASENDDKIMSTNPENGVNIMKTNKSDDNKYEIYENDNFLFDKQNINQPKIKTPQINQNQLIYKSTN